MKTSVFLYSKFYEKGKLVFIFLFDLVFIPLRTAHIRRPLLRFIIIISAEEVEGEVS